MIYHIFLSLFSVIVATFAAKTNITTLPTDKVECLCPQEFVDDECISQILCVYGINDHAEIFINGKNDKMELTKIALQRMEEISNFRAVDVDDVLVNLYNVYDPSMMIFYYACRECDDLKKFGNITVPRLKVFLLSLYNQRMKYNVRYAQSDYQYFLTHFTCSLSDGLDSKCIHVPVEDHLQPMPVITVRPFWKNRLMLNRTCAHKQKGFTQKHFIPAFLTQNLCVLDYKYAQYRDIQKVFHTVNGEILYSLTLSYNDLYKYNVALNSTLELPSEFKYKLEACKSTFQLQLNLRLIRFFCLCSTSSCTIKVTNNNPLITCPYKFAAKIDEEERSIVYTVSEFMNVDKFFMRNKQYCFFAWRFSNNDHSGFIRTQDAALPIGYTVNISSALTGKQRLFCPLYNYTKENLIPFRTRFYQNDPKDLHYAFLNATIDHTKIIGDIYPIGANCSSEGPLSDPWFSSGYNSTPSMFPCYKYYDIYRENQQFPIMGINVIPITIMSKGNHCYYYNVKVYDNNMAACDFPIQLDHLMIVAACPENIDYDEAEFQRMKKISGACPRMKPGRRKWRLKAPSTNATVIVCGQFLRGLKMKNGKYVPEEVELRHVRNSELKMIGLDTILHGCGFISSQNLTICTCFAALGGCHDLYTAGRVHLLRYLPFKDS